MKTRTPVVLVPILLLWNVQVLLANAHGVRRALGASGSTFQGDGTSYELTDPFNGNCNFMSFPDEARTKYAAINTPQFNHTVNCGRCAQVSCVDSKCTSHNSEIVYFVDQCPGCLHGDLDLSPQVFKTISGLSYDRIKIEWKYVDCPVANNPIKYCLKVGSNPFWTAIQPTNFAVGIDTIRVNDQATVMVDSAYYFLADGKSQQQTTLSSVHLTVVSITGETIEENVDLSKGGCTQGSKQFTRRDPSSAKDFGDGGSQTKPQAQASPEVLATTPAPTSSPVAVPVSTPVVTEAPKPSPSSSSSSSSGSAASSRAAPKLESEAGNPAQAVEPDTATSANGGEVGGNEVVTRAKATQSTSWSVIFLSALACIGAVILIVMIFVVRSRTTEEPKDVDEPARRDHNRTWADTMETLRTLDSPSQHLQLSFMNM